jgi:hypothetical protein
LKKQHDERTAYLRGAPEALDTSSEPAAGSSLRGGAGPARSERDVLWCSTDGSSGGVAKAISDAETASCGGRATAVRCMSRR